MTEGLLAGSTPGPVARAARRGSPRRFAVLGTRGYPSTYGGFETFVRRLAPYLVAQGADVTVYGRDATSPGHRVMADGVHVVNTRGYDTRTASTLSHGRSSVQHASYEGYDAALVLNCAMGFWLPELRAAGIPTLLNVDGIEWERGKWSTVGKRVFRRGAAMSARYADRLVADSVGIKDYWSRTFGVDPTFIPYGADVLGQVGHDRLDPLGLTPGGYVLVVARLAPENNVELLLAAVQRAAHRHPVVVVGSAPPGDPFEAKLHEAGRGADVRWLGHVADQRLLEQLWQHCGVYVHGHSVGGTNPGLLQALGAGSPTIVLDTVFNREVVGAACPTYAHDPDDLARRIDQVMGDEMTRAQLRRAGREIVRARYSWDDVCRDYLVELEALAVLRKNHHRWSPAEVSSR
jgi:glycosyltransferase involved in cell wall biosynthesis